MAQHHVSSGRLGGLATVRRYGVEHMREIGRRGALSFHMRYRLSPDGQSDFLVIVRASGRVVGSLAGRPLSRREVM